MRNQKWIVVGKSIILDKMIKKYFLTRCYLCRDLNEVREGNKHIHVGIAFWKE